MDCANCAKTIERGVAQLSGIEHVEVSFATEMLEARGRIDSTALQDRIRQLGFGVTDPTLQAGDAQAGDGARSFFGFLWSAWHGRVAVLATLVIGAAGVVRIASAAMPANAFSAILAATVVVVSAPIALKGLRAVFFARQITIDLLMTIAAIGALFIGAYGEAAAVMLLFSLGEALEGYSAARSRDAIGGLIKLQPQTAVVLEQHHGHVHQHERDIETLQPGQRVLVKAGERVPADGRVAEGESAVDESAITGEPIPVTRGIGDDVFAGTVNGDGTLEIEVTSNPSEFTIARIARLVEQAQSARSPAERYVDRFARWYTPAVVVLAVAVATLPPLLFGLPFLDSAVGNAGAAAGSAGVEHGWLYRGLALLIIACPCALVLSIPVTVVSALARLAKNGVLVKGGAQLAELARVRAFAFDKTGTLTHGRPVVSGLRGIDCAHESNAHNGCAPCDEVVAVAAAVESGSSHPLANAVMHAASERAVDARYARATEVQSHAGRGVSGMIDGARVSVGNQAIAATSAGVDALLSHTASETASLVIVSRDDKALGLIEVSDAVRNEVSEAIAALRKLNGEYRFAMLTGDRREVAEALAQSIGGIDDIRAGLQPGEKLEAIRELEAVHGTVAMVGDGINDTPALAGARLGIAMGARGSAQAMEAADIVLMRDRLGSLAEAVSVARRTQRRIAENVALSLVFKAIFLALAVPGLATLWMAVLADVGTTLIVTLNGMRILRERSTSLT